MKDVFLRNLSQEVVIDLDKDQPKETYVFLVIKAL